MHLQKIDFKEKTLKQELPFLMKISQVLLALIQQMLQLAEVKKKLKLKLKEAKGQMVKLLVLLELKNSQRKETKITMPKSMKITNHCHQLFLFLSMEKWVKLLQLN